MTKKQIIQARYKENPNLNRQALADELGVNVRTVYKAIAAVNTEVISADDEEQDLRKPTKSFDPETEVYIIRYGKLKMHSVEATNEQIRKAFMMHKTSIGNLTENQVAMEMKWTKREFQAIKHAFDFTKDAAPFTDHDIENMSSEQMAEYERIEKKRYALLKLETKKHDDIKREIKRHHQADYFLNRISEAFAVREPIEYIPQKVDFILDDIEVYNVRIADIHAGLEVDNVFGTYNLELVKKRFMAVYSSICLNIPKGSRLILTDGGDSLHGKIHGSTEKHGTYVVTATVELLRIYEWLIAKLLENYTVEFAKVNGSHESLESNKQNRTEEENLGNLILYAIERIFSNCENFKVIHMLKGLPHTVINIVPGFDVLLDHGDNMPLKHYVGAARRLNATQGYNIQEVWLAHRHQYIVNNPEHSDQYGILVETTESFCPSDQYAAPKGLTGRNGFRIIAYGNSGRVGYGKFIDLSDVK